MSGRFRELAKKIAKEIKRDESRRDIPESTQSESKKINVPVKERLYYNRDAGAYGLSRSTKTNKFLLTPEEYTKWCNEGKNKDTASQSYWVERYQDSHVLVTEELITVDEPKTAKTIPAGVFQTMRDVHGNMFFKEMTFKKDKYYPLSSFDKNIIGDLDFFLNNEKRYRDMNFSYRRGVLLFGPPGNGKTMAIEQVCEIYKDKARIIFIRPNHLGSLIEDTLYNALQDLPIILVLEEVVSFMCNDDCMSMLLSFLDGEKSWDNVFIIATTNYPEKLPDNFIDRPSRFDRLYKVDNPNEKVRTLYLSKLLNKEVDKSIVAQTEGFSLAYLKELVVASKIYGRTISEVIKEFKNRKLMIKHGFETKRQAMGFSNSEEIQEEQVKRSIGFNNDK